MILIAIFSALTIPSCLYAIWRQIKLRRMRYNSAADVFVMVTLIFILIACSHLLVHSVSHL